MHFVRIILSNPVIFIVQNSKQASTNVVGKSRYWRKNKNIMNLDSIRDREFVLLTDAYCHHDDTMNP
jgi:hypothetical protein